MENKAEEFLNVIKQSLAGDDEVDGDEFLAILMDYTNYICGKESPDDVYQHLARRLSQKMEEIGEDEFGKLSDEFLEKIKKEDEERDRLELEMMNRWEERTNERKKREEEMKVRMAELKVGEERLRKQKELDQIKRQNENNLVSNAQTLLDNMIENDNDLVQIFQELKKIMATIPDFDVINYVKIMVILRTFITICDKNIKNINTCETKKIQYIELLKEFKNEYNKNIDMRKSKK